MRAGRWPAAPAVGDGAACARRARRRRVRAASPRGASPAARARRRPTTSTTTRSPSSACGRSTRSPCCSPAPNGRRSSTVWCSAPSCSSWCSPISTDRRMLVRRGLLPPEVVFAHSGFARPCVGVAPPGGRHLPLYAADLARRPDGERCVLGDRSPGAVRRRLRARESRRAVAHPAERLPRRARASPAAVPAAHARGAGGPRARRQRQPADRAPHARARATRRSSSRRCSPASSAVRWRRATTSPCAISACGCARSTVSRASTSSCAVSTALSAIRSSCSHDSILGTPGLLQTVRAGGVALLNPLGTSAVENPGLMPFLPALARALLGEDLALPSVPTWWCGDPASRAYVLENLAQLVVKPIDPHASRVTAFGDASRRGGTADAARADRWRGRTPSSARSACRCPPCRYWSDGHLEPRAIVLRAFLVADSDGYAVMPGGLCRVAPSPGTLMVSNQQRRRQQGRLGARVRAGSRGRTARAGGRIRCWSSAAGRKCPGASPTICSGSAAMPSAPRSTARVLREALSRTLEVDTAPYDAHRTALLRAVTWITGAFPGFDGQRRCRATRGARARAARAALRPRARRQRAASTSRRWRAPRGRPRSPVDRYLAGARHHAARSRRCRAAGGGARATRAPADAARRLRRSQRRQHEPRPALALPRDRPTPGARRRRRQPVARPLSAGHRGGCRAVGGAAQRRRRLDHLSAALSRDGRRRRRARPAARRREQPALPRATSCASSTRCSTA